jgi:hypothetical protein
MGDETGEKSASYETHSIQITDEMYCGKVSHEDFSKRIAWKKIKDAQYLELITSECHILKWHAEDYPENDAEILTDDLQQVRGRNWTHGEQILASWIIAQLRYGRLRAFAKRARPGEPFRWVPRSEWERLDLASVHAWSALFDANRPSIFTLVENEPALVDVHVVLADDPDLRMVNEREEAAYEARQRESDATVASVVHSDTSEPIPTPLPTQISRALDELIERLTGEFDKNTQPNWRASDWKKRALVHAPWMNDNKWREDILPPLRRIRPEISVGGRSPKRPRPSGKTGGKPSGQNHTEESAPNGGKPGSAGESEGSVRLILSTRGKP